MNKSPFIVIATIEKPHGLQGAVKLRLHHQPSVFGDAHVPLFIGREAHSLQPITCLSIRPTPHGAIVTFNGYSHIDQAKLLQSLKIWVDKKSLPALATGEYYHHQLLDCSVIRANGTLLGQVKAIETNAGADNLVVVSQQGQEVMIPLISDAIAQIDLPNHSIHLTNMQGVVDETF